MTRRRALLIAGSALGSALLGGQARGATRPYRWRGEVLGAQASILLEGMGPGRARRLVGECLREIGRLEDVFSLYRPDSALCRLNRDGALAHPPRELVALLGEALRFGEATAGAFDVTVQPLWELYARHFAEAGADPAGPPVAARKAVLRLVDYRAVEIAPHRIAFARPGMAVTLNGIAQGYITDRVAELLRDRGVRHVLVDLGEFHALGRHESGEKWRVGLVDPRRPYRIGQTVAVADEAVASSGSYGTRFDPAGRSHHLFDCASGASAHYNLGVTVIAPTATVADALSTALSVMPREPALACLERFAGARAIVTALDGSVTTWPAGPVP